MKLSVFAVTLLFLASASARGASVLIEDLTWLEIRDAIAAGRTTAIYYAGSTEQNGPHITTGKHNFIARYAAQQIAERLGDALVYPIMPFAPTGDAMARTDHMRFPGSVSVSDETFAAVAKEVALSAIAAGFRHIALMGDHGGGQGALKRTAAELDLQWKAKGIRVHYVPDVYYKAQDEIDRYLAARKIRGGGHAAAVDTSEVMSIDPEHKWVRTGKLALGTAGTGVEGDPRSASAELGSVLMKMKIDAAVTQIRLLTQR